MFLKNLYLKNFRNYQEISLDFSEGVNLVLGSNGAGKSNLLESIYLLSTSKSFRNVPDQQIKNWEEEGYLVKGSFVSIYGDKTIAVEYNGGKKSLYIDGMVQERISEIIGQIYCVMFHFEDINIITGPPSQRRKFLDLTLSTVDPVYFSNLRLYLKALKQKNRYLKNTTAVDENLVYAWNSQLAESGAYILSKRNMLIQYFNRVISNIAGSFEDFMFPFRIIYRPNISCDAETSGDCQLEQCYDLVREKISQVLENKMQSEIHASQSLMGPHRDNFLFTDENFEVRYFGSIGQARLSSIILKLAQSSFYHHSTGIFPMLLMDDILLELDMKNRERVLIMIEKEKQKIVTTTEKTKLPEIFSFKKLFTIRKKGKVECTEIQEPIQ